jgi:cytoskeletal protein CcmA (bactofilin family)
MDLYIDGEVEGKIHMGKSAVTVGPNGHVSADIEAREIFVQGAVQGNLLGSDRVVLGRSSHVDGDVTAQRVVIEEGASFRGRIEVGPGGGFRESRAPAAGHKKEGIQ